MTRVKDCYLAAQSNDSSAPPVPNRRRSSCKGTGGLRIRRRLRARPTFRPVELSSEFLGHRNIKSFSSRTGLVRVAGSAADLAETWT